MLKNNTLIKLEKTKTIGDFDLTYNTTNTQSIQVIDTDPFYGVILKYDGDVDLFFFNKSTGFIQIEDSMTLKNLASLYENDVSDIFGLLPKKSLTDIDQMFYVDLDNRINKVDIYVLINN